MKLTRSPLLKFWPPLSKFWPSLSNIGLLCLFLYLITNDTDYSANNVHGRPQSAAGLPWWEGAGELGSLVPKNCLYGGPGGAHKIGQVLVNV